MAATSGKVIPATGATQLAHGPGSTEYGRMVDTPGPGRPLVYPYTGIAKMIQFPWRLNFQRNWVYRYYVIGWIVGLPLFYKIHKIANSPENVEKWNGIREQWRQEALGNVKH